MEVSVYTRTCYIFLLLHQLDLRPMIGSNATDLWVMFSETQVREHGLWCQVGPDSAVGMGSDIGNWYYPSLNGFTLLTNTINDGTPYLSLKCSNQIALIVDGDVTYYQGIVKCHSVIPNLNRNTIYMAVYGDQVYHSYGELYFTDNYYFITFLLTFFHQVVQQSILLWHFLYFHQEILAQISHLNSLSMSPLALHLQLNALMAVK